MDLSNKDALGEPTSGNPTSTNSDLDSLEKRLRCRDFNLQETKAAIQGHQLPTDLGRLVTQHAVVRGIRYHPSFALGPAAVLRGVRPLFTRALNARAIMSNTIPEISAAADFPYCIWHPDLPSQETLQELAARYPEMRYQVGRTCAIAGHFDVYQNLDLLPEVAIAEEARESGNLDIYEHILKAPIKWRVFDDCNGIIHHSDPRPARLNGDTCIRSWLDLKQPVKAPFGLVDGEEGDPTSGDDADSEDELGFCLNEPFGFPGYNTPPYEVTEDKQLDVKSSRARSSFDSPDWEPASHITDERNWDGPREPLPELPDVVKKLLYEPLPEDLPTCNKDWLIRMAAYTGNVDRYTRLRRPWFVEDELRCLERGIYHNALFARWWATQITKDTSHIIRRAINARYIMSDDLSRFLGNDKLDQPFDLPYHIWHPDVARVETYWALAVHFPNMRHQVTRAAIYADYQGLFDLLMNGSSGEAGPSDLATRDLRKVVDVSEAYMRSCSNEPMYERIWRQDLPAASSQRVDDLFTVSNDMEPVKPDHYLYLEAHFSSNPHYKTTLLKKAADLELDITSPEAFPYMPRRERLECVGEAHKLRLAFTPESIRIAVDEGNFTCDARALESYVLMPEEWRPSPEEVSSFDKSSYYLLCYANWPRSVWAMTSSV
ncbi:hypothetical protein F5X68DRAFT_11869 [Plectosphaerella plurivora]|uniref:Uncharacterized protein n=1 Tax=Plectosphaerella plurivora TaxID=936078 RepID=A0A9P9AAM1_9PEZI|nr:hypothetical protein F5X68DRAFT_11869 [Plectosphaerella plurivora]